MADSNTKALAILSHLLGILTGFIGPLIIYLITEDKKAKMHAKKSLNWQISLILYYIISAVLILILIGFVFMFALVILNIIFCIIAAVKANDDVLWNYPLSIPFVK